MGFITSPDSTGPDGILTVYYITEPAQYGPVIITASVGDVSTSRTLEILGPSEYTLSLNYWPPVPKLIDHEGDPYTITALLVDTTQVGVGGQPVHINGEVMLLENTELEEWEKILEAFETY